MLKYVRETMNSLPVIFSEEQRLFIEQSMTEVCKRGGWRLHEVACQPDHVHILLTIETEAKSVRKWIKTWLSQLMNEKNGNRKWWAKGGSCKYIFDDEYFAVVKEYIREQKAGT